MPSDERPGPMSSGTLHNPEPTRRTLLGAAGSLLLTAWAILFPPNQTAEAARPVDRLQRRARNRHHHRSNRARHRRHARTMSGGPQIFQKGISMHLNNHIDQMTNAELGILINGSSGGCRSPALFPMPALTGIAIYDTQHAEAYSWIEERFFFGFFNPEIGLPVFWVADGGSSKGNCHRGGTRILNDYELGVGQSFTVNVANRRFVVTRHTDTEFKLFVVDIYAA